MIFNECVLKDLTIDGRGYYGIGASAVPYDINKFTYLRITDINDDGTLNYSGLMSVDDKDADKYLLQPNDIVFARTGASTGRNYLYDGEIANMVYAGFLIKYSLDSEKVNPKYVKYYCLSKTYRDWVKSVMTGSTRGNVNEKQFGNMPIMVPERHIQDKIVILLDSLTNKIKLNNEINNNLHELLKNLYEDWFINYNYPKSKENLHEDWIIDKMGNYLNIERGLSYKGKFLSEEGVPMINLGNVMPNGVFRLEKNKYYSGDYKEKVTAKVGDIVIANTDMTQNREVIGSPVIIPNVYNSDIIYSHHVYGVKNLKLPRMFIFYTLLRKEFRAIAGGSATGTTVLALPKDVIENYEIQIPDEETLKEFSRMSEVIYQKRENLILQNIKLEQLRDTLLPKLMNGEIDLDNIEI